MKLYNTVVRIVDQIPADSPEEAHQLLAATVGKAFEVLPMEREDVFVSEPDPNYNWDGEKFT